MNRKKSELSSYLKSRFSFWSGFGSVLSLAGNYYPAQKPLNDRQAMMKDWQMVGQDLWGAIDQLKKEKR